MTTFITPPEENNEDSAEEEINPWIAHFSRNMPEAEAEIVIKEADSDTQQKAKKKKWKRNNVNGKNMTWKKLKNLQFPKTMKPQKMILWICINNGLLQNFPYY